MMFHPRPVASAVQARAATMPPTSRLRCLLVAILPLGAACGVETYPVAIDSPEVEQATLSVQLDRSGDEPVLRAAFQLRSTRQGSCPVVTEDAKVLLERDGAKSVLQVESRGDGHVGVECAFKCQELIAFEANCTPITANLRGAEVAALIGGGAARIVIEDATGSRGVTLDASALQPREVVLPGGSTIVARRNLPSEYQFTTVPFEWSHADVGHWVSQWSDHPVGSRDGAFSAFNLAAASRGGDSIALTVRGDINAGLHAVYAGAWAAPTQCDVAACEGIEHVVKREVTISYP